MSRTFKRRVIFFSILSSFLIGAAKATIESASNQDQFVSRIYSACKKTASEFLENYQPVCDCVYRNYKTVTISLEDLELMTLSHEGSQEAQDKLQDEKYTDLILMDYDITEGCTEDPSYTYKPQLPSH